ncbi:MAG: ATP synthase F1 subunit delta [Ruminococcaceae bacterium]|nr:ATP synthase F1 subunit delta [Oscillospiraceae bacterium]
MNNITTEYGGGLFALAEEEHLEEELLLETRALTPLLTPDYLHLLINPSLSKEKRISLAGELLDGRVNKYTANFVKLMVERGFADEIVSCFGEYERLYYEKFGIIKVRAESAVELSEEQKEKLNAKLCSHTGKRVEIEYVVDKTLIGGMRIVQSDRLIDDSIKQKLGEIGGLLASTVI